MPMYTLADFAFDLPPELIAQVPAPARTGSRLLHVDGARIEDFGFTDLPGLLRAGDLLVFNDTRVINARVFARKSTGGKVELLVERVQGSDEAWVQLRASRSPAVGSVLDLPGDAHATIIDRDDRFWRLRFAGTGPLVAWLDVHGDVPLPPYLARRPGQDDSARYQTVYARAPGAVAAPTAGLHFDAAILAELAARGIGQAFVTLHVGAGTFHPVKSNDLSLHRMHREWYKIPQETSDAVAATIARGGRIVAVGTTSLRALEAAARPDTQSMGESGRSSGTDRGLRCGAGETDLFITPGYRFRVADRLITNFHLPRSTLLMLVAAFAGMEPVRAAYRHAIAERYRFYSYGDAMLIDRIEPAPDSAN